VVKQKTMHQSSFGQTIKVIGVAIGITAFFAYNIFGKPALAASKPGNDTIPQSPASIYARLPISSQQLVGTIQNQANRDEALQAKRNDERNNGLPISCDVSPEFVLRTLVDQSKKISQSLPHAISILEQRIEGLEKLRGNMSEGWFNTTTITLQKDLAVLRAFQSLPEDQQQSILKAISETYFVK